MPGSYFILTTARTPVHNVSRKLVRLPHVAFPKIKRNLTRFSALYSLLLWCLAD